LYTKNLIDKKLKGAAMSIGTSLAIFGSIPEVIKIFRSIVLSDQIISRLTMNFIPDFK
jgi:hypothetical protein